MKDHALFGPITQIGYLTNDIEGTARAWAAGAGVGPWTVMKNVVMEAIMDGVRSDIEIDVALAYQGDVQIELIRPINDAPSPYREYADAGIWGLHHLQYTTDDMDSTLAKAERSGLEVSCLIEQGGGKYAYLKGPSVWFEVMEASEGLLGLFQMIKTNGRDADGNWDGNNMLRDLAL